MYRAIGHLASYFFTTPSSSGSGIVSEIHGIASVNSEPGNKLAGYLGPEAFPVPVAAETRSSDPRIDTCYPTAEAGCSTFEIGRFGFLFHQRVVILGLGLCSRVHFALYTPCIA